MQQPGGFGGRGPTRRSRDFFDANRRHIEPGWYEWMLREFVRYFYMLGILAGLFMVPLQFTAWWLPPRASALVDPAIVAILVIGFILGLLYAGWRGYSYLWRAGGYVDRALAVRGVRSGQTPKSPLRP